MVSRSIVACKALFLFIVSLVLSQAVRAEVMAIVERYPNGSIQSVERAEQALTDIEAERQAVDARFAESERACYERFFATDCLQKAKDERRDALTRMRPIEIEAHTFKRRARAEAREKAAAERTTRREAEANERLQATGAPPPGGSGDAQIDDAAAAEQQAREAEDARRRANVRDYEKKVRAAESRQREIAARKARAVQEKACGGNCRSTK